MTTEKHYVTMTDKFMSGWGHAEGKLNKLIFVCDSLEQAEIVQENAQNRDEMKNINIVKKRPSYPKGTHYTQLKTINDMPRWYEKGFFTKTEWYDKNKHEDMVSDLRDGYLHESVLKFPKNVAKYIKLKEVPVFSNNDFSFGKDGVALTGIKSALNQCVYELSEGFKEDEITTSRESLMFERLEAITVTDHESGYVTINLHASSLDYTSEIVVEGGGTMKRGMLVG